MENSQVHKSNAVSSKAVANQQSQHNNALSLPAVSAMATGQPVIQAKWDDAGPDFLKWTPATASGHTWWYRRSDAAMAYTEAGVGELSGQVAEGLRWRSYKDWQTDALEQLYPNPDAGQVAPSSDINEMVTKGKKRWDEMNAAVKERGGQLDPTTQEARTWFFEKYYKTKGKQGDDGDVKGMEAAPEKKPVWDMASNYDARPASYNNKRAKGEYTTTVDFETGTMIPNQTYALGGPGELYYNPKTGNAERMPTSEILFQQWKMAAAGKRTPRLNVKEETVAGDGIPMINSIRASLDEKGIIPKTDKTDIEFIPMGGLIGYFYALLAVPNVTASLYLISDHGYELGINTINMIKLSHRKHITVYFGYVPRK